MKHFFLLTITLTFISISGIAQNSKFYQSVRFILYTEYSKAPAGLESYQVDPIASKPVYSDSVYSSLGGGLSTIGILYHIRYNVVDINDDFGIGIDFAPSLSLSSTDYGYGAAYLPIFISANFGAGSTYESGKNGGGFIGVGYEYNFTNILNDYNTNDNSDKYYPYTQTVIPVNNWGQLMVTGGYRWWAGDHVYDIGLKLGYGNSGDNIPEKVIDELGKSYSVQLSFGYLINY